MAIALRGLFMGNRGCLHRKPYEIARPWQVRRWITCVLQYKDWVAPRWEPRRWTPLFFWDEAVAIAAGHRPCALCRRGDYNRWLDAWEAAFGERAGADAMDVVLHADRLDGRTQRRHTAAWDDLPTGVFVEHNGTPSVVLDDRLVAWSVDGYGEPIERPTRGTATVLTPRASLEVVRHGYRPEIHK